jgi:hypothetical protein
MRDDEQLLNAGRAISFLTAVAVLVVFVAASLKADVAGDYMAGIRSNLPTALIAVIFGIPAGLWLNRIITQGAAAQIAAKVKEALKNDLTEVKDRLTNYIAVVQNGKQRPLSMPFTGNDLWLAYSRSGELSALTDGAMIANLSNTYRILASIGHAERELYAAMRLQGMKTWDSRPALYGDLNTLDPVALNLVTETLALL